MYYDKNVIFMYEYKYVMLLLNAICIWSWYHNICQALHLTLEKRIFKSTILFTNGCNYHMKLVKRLFKVIQGDWLINLNLS